MSSDVSPQSRSLLSRLRSTHPEDYQYIRNEVLSRSAVGQRSTPIRLPKEWETERKNRLYTVMKEIGFSPQTTRSHSFYGPPKQGFLRPLQEEMDSLDEIDLDGGYEDLHNESLAMEETRSDTALEGLSKQLQTLAMDTTPDMGSTNTTIALGTEPSNEANTLSATASIDTSSSSKVSTDISDRKENAENIPFSPTAHKYAKPSHTVKASLVVIGNWTLDGMEQHKSEKRYELDIKLNHVEGLFGVLVEDREEKVHYEMEFMICDIAKLQNDFGRLILSVKATEAVVYKKYTMGNALARSCGSDDIPSGGLSAHNRIMIQYARRETCERHYSILTEFLNRKQQSGGLCAYKILPVVLGEGAYAKVKLCEHRKSGKQFAIKIIDKTKLNPAQLQRILREFHISDALKHPNIVRMEDMFEDADTIYIVMEYVKGGDLNNLINEHRGLTEDDTREIMQQLFVALDFVHKQNKIHRDLKPENVLLEKSIVKLCDFGEARELTFDPTSDPKLCGATTFVGTYKYLAPEIIDVLFERRKYYNQACDLWSCGVILYNCLSMKEPFTEQKVINGERVGLGKQISNALYDFNDDVWKDVSDEGKDLISKLLVREGLEDQFAIVKKCKYCSCMCIL